MTLLTASGLSSAETLEARGERVEVEAIFRHYARDQIAADERQRSRLEGPVTPTLYCRSDGEPEGTPSPAASAICQGREPAISYTIVDTLGRIHRVRPVQLPTLIRQLRRDVENREAEDRARQLRETEQRLAEHRARVLEQIRARIRAGDSAGALRAVAREWPHQEDDPDRLRSLQIALPAATAEAESLARERPSEAVGLVELALEVDLDRARSAFDTALRLAAEEALRRRDTGSADRALTLAAKERSGDPPQWVGIYRAELEVLRGGSGSAAVRGESNAAAPAQPREQEAIDRREQPSEREGLGDRAIAEPDPALAAATSRRVLEVSQRTRAPVGRVEETQWSWLDAAFSLAESTQPETDLESIVAELDELDASQAPPLVARFADGLAEIAAALPAEQTGLRGRLLESSARLAIRAGPSNDREGPGRRAVALYLEETRSRLATLLSDGETARALDVLASAEALAWSSPEIARLGVETRTQAGWGLLLDNPARARSLFDEAITSGAGAPAVVGSALADCLAGLHPTPVQIALALALAANLYALLRAADARGDHASSAVLAARDPSPKQNLEGRPAAIAGRRTGGTAPAEDPFDLARWLEFPVDRRS